MKPLDPMHADNYPHQTDSDYPDWRDACPRCEWCGTPIDEDVGCKNEDCEGEEASDDEL